MLGAVGFPGAVDGYQGNSRVPAVRGLATIQMSCHRCGHVRERYGSMTTRRRELVFSLMSQAASKIGKGAPVSGLTLVFTMSGSNRAPNLREVAARN